jgi:predicted nucleic acid-binding protein
MKVLVDTGIFVNVLNGESDAESSANLLQKIYNRKIHGVISTIALSEILAIFYRIDENTTVKAKIYVESIIGAKSIIPVFKSVAELAGKIKAGHKLSLGDALIISTAILTDCDYVITRDPEIETVQIINTRKPEEIE